MARAILLAMCCMQAMGAANIFFAKVKPLESHGPVAWVAVAITPGGLVGIGMAKGLEPRLRAAPRGANCTAANGCGTHVHSGTACTNTATQGGHYFSANVPDPWASVGYTSTTRGGSTLFKFSIETTAQDVSQKPFIIHNNAGGRVGCGLLHPISSGKLPKYAAHLSHLLHTKTMPTIEELEDYEDDTDNGESDEDDEANAEDDDDNEEEEANDDEDEEDAKEEAIRPANVWFLAKMTPLGSQGPAGWAAVTVTPNGLVGFGMAKDLEPKLRASPYGVNCTATNGCGTHVHSGTSCTNTTMQGGHYFAANATDPWSPIGYSFTTRRGSTLFKFSIETTAQDISQKPFIIHNNAGGRVACGLLDPISKLPKYAANLWRMRKMPAIEELDGDEDDNGNMVDDEHDAADAEDHDDDEEDDDDTQNGDEDDDRRRLGSTTVLI